MEITENNIEFLTGEKTCTASFSNRKHINRVKKLHTEHPDDFDYFVENADGSVCVKFPLSWVKISPKRTGRKYTEEERRVIAERFKKAREKKTSE